jgi:hypothetical protein
MRLICLDSFCTSKYPFGVIYVNSDLAAIFSMVILLTYADRSRILSQGFPAGFCQPSALRINQLSELIGIARASRLYCPIAPE